MPSFRKMLRRWAAIVRGLRKSCAATSRLLSPCATTRRLAARAQLDACPFRPQFGPECLESVESRPKMLACQARSSCSAEELAEGELGARTFEGARRLGVHVERGLEEAFGLLVVV